MYAETEGPGRRDDARAFLFILDFSLAKRKSKVIRLWGYEVMGLGWESDLSDLSDLPDLSDSSDFSDREPGCVLALRR